MITPAYPNRTRGEPGVNNHGGNQVSSTLDLQVTVATTYDLPENHPKPTSCLLDPGTQRVRIANL